MKSSTLKFFSSLSSCSAAAALLFMNSKNVHASRIISTSDKGKTIGNLFDLFARILPGRLFPRGQLGLFRKFLDRGIMDAALRVLTIFESEDGRNIVASLDAPSELEGAVCGAVIGAWELMTHLRLYFYDAHAAFCCQNKSLIPLAVNAALADALEDDNYARVNNRNNASPGELYDIFKNWRIRKMAAAGRMLFAPLVLHNRALERFDQEEGMTVDDERDDDDDEDNDKDYSSLKRVQRLRQLLSPDEGGIADPSRLVQVFVVAFKLLRGVVQTVVRESFRQFQLRRESDDEEPDLAQYHCCDEIRRTALLALIAFALLRNSVGAAQQQEKRRQRETVEDDSDLWNGVSDFVRRVQTDPDILALKAEQPLFASSPDCDAEDEEDFVVDRMNSAAVSHLFHVLVDDSSKELFSETLDE